MNATVVRVVAVLGLSVALSARVVAAPDRIAQLTYLDGAAAILHEHIPVHARVGAWLAHGDEVHTGNGRAEITFPDGSVLHLDRESRIAVYERERFFVIDGRVVFRSTSLSPRGYEAHTDMGRLRVLPQGVFGILVDEKNQQVLVSVAVGEAQVESPWGHTQLTSRQMALVSGATGRPYVTPFSPGRGDGFESWASLRVFDAAISASTAARLPMVETPRPVIDPYRDSSPYSAGWIPPLPLTYPDRQLWRPGLYPYEFHDAVPYGYNSHGRRAMPQVPPPAPNDFSHYLPRLYPLNQYATRPESPAPRPTPAPAPPQVRPRPVPEQPAQPPPAINDSVAVGRAAQPRRP